MNLIRTTFALAAVIGLAACSEDNSVMPETMKKTPAVSDTTAIRSNTEKKTSSDNGCLSSLECAILDDGSSIDNRSLDIIIPALIDEYMRDPVFEKLGVSMDSRVMAYYSQGEYGKLGLELKTGLNKVDMETFSKVPHLSDKLAIRGNSEGCNYYVLEKESSGVQSLTLVKDVSADSIVVLEIQSGDGTCKDLRDSGKEGFFLEVCGSSLDLQTPVVHRTLLDSSRACNTFMYDFGKWFRSDVYYAGVKNPYDEPEEETPLEMDVPGTCYSPCAPGEDICVTVCANHPYEVQRFLDSLARSFAGDVTVESDPYPEDAAYYDYRTEAKDVYSWQEKDESAYCLVQTVEEEGGVYYAEYEKDKRLLSRNVVLKTIRSLPVIVELYHETFFTGEADADAFDREISSSCYERLGSYYRYTLRDKGTVAAACILVNYDNISLKHETDNLINSCKDGH